MGPFSKDDLSELLAENRISAQTLMWNKGMSNWETFANVPELQAILSDLPPDIPVVETRSSEISPPPLPQEVPLLGTSTFSPKEHVMPFTASVQAGLDSAGAWRRFFARLIDIYLISMPLGLAIAYFGSRQSSDFTLWLGKPGSNIVFDLAVLPLALILESTIFGWFGTTIGKGILGVRVLTETLKRPTFLEYLERQISVYFYGLAIGFPLISLFTMARQSGRLKKGLRASYDDQRFVIRGPRRALIRGAVAVAVLIALFFVNAVLLQINKTTTNETDQARPNGSPTSLPINRGTAAATNVALSWRNPTTGKVANLAPGWTLSIQTNGTNQETWLFENQGASTVIVLSYEDVEPNVTIAQYERAWIDKDKRIMTMHLLPLYKRDAKGRDVAYCYGTLEGSSGATAMLSMQNGRVWRLIHIRMGTMVQYTTPVADTAIARLNETF